MKNTKKSELLKKNYDIWKRDALNNNGFFIIFNGFVDQNILTKISGGALKLYIFLGIKSNNKTGESFYTISQMADYFQTSERTISNWILELEKLNLIIRYQLKFNSVAHTFLNPYNAGSLRANKNIE